MDSDVSAEGEFENESPKNRSWMSSNSDGQQSSPTSPVRNSDQASCSSEAEGSPNAKPVSSSDSESSPDAKDSDADVFDKDDEVEESSSDIKEIAGSDIESSPDGRADIEPASATATAVAQYESPSQLSHERNGSDRESSPDSKDDENFDDGVENVGNSPIASENHSPAGSISEKQSPLVASICAGSKVQAVHSDVEADDDVTDTLCRSVNGDISPKSVKRSNSVGWDSRSDIASSLDSVSPSQFERQASSKLQNDDDDDEDDEKFFDCQKEKDSSSKKNIIDFADDLSDVSDIESNDSFIENDEDHKETDEKLNNDSHRHQTQQQHRRQQQQQQLHHPHHHQHHRHRQHQHQHQQPEEEQQQHVHHQSPLQHHNHNSNRHVGVTGETTDGIAGSEKQQHMDDAVSLHVEGEEQLDFEAEEGECSPKLEKIAKHKGMEEMKKEKEESDLEEGELTDDNDAKPEETERPVCRFFSRGHCTWGSNCRFIHPGVMDKGNYSMFETVRPIITAGAAAPVSNPSASMLYPVFPPHLSHSHVAGAERSGVGVMSGGSGAMSSRKDEPALESAWERGLRQAKEMIRKSSKRKETEVDFEDKKMNLTLSQDEIDKENDYYSRNSSSPTNKSPDVNDKWKLEGDVKSHRLVSGGEPYGGNDLAGGISHAAADVPPLGYYPTLHHGISRPDYWGAHRISGLPYDEYGLRAPPLPYGAEYYSAAAAAAAAAAGRRYMHPNSYYAPPRPANVSAPSSHHAEFYDRKQKHKQYQSSGREVIVQKNDKTYKDDSPSSRYRNRREDSPRVERARDDEWADPWMRTKSPASGRARRRKDTYSSGSSYSSSSESSRSSSRSSFSSKSRHSRSRSKARSSGSHSQSHSSSRSASESQVMRKKAPMQFKLSPSSRSQLPAPKKAAIKSVSPTLLLERRAATERAMHMNPPPPSPKIKTRPHSPPTTNMGGVGGSGASFSAPSAASPRAKSGLPDRLLAHSKAAVAAAMRSARSSESRSSKSSSGSSSSDSSSDSSDSSASSSSTSKSSKTPPIRVQKRVPVAAVAPSVNAAADDHSAASQTVKNKAMDALKLSGQKQQIKLTLKGSANVSQSKRAAPNDNSDSRKEKFTSTSKKRLAESSNSDSDSDTTSPAAKKSGKLNQKKGVPSRREELLKQLKAVEDAIARKRSKIS